MNAAAYQLAEKILQLPQLRQAEVADFVDFLRAREQDRALAQAAAQTATTSFAAVWDNDSDADYDKL
ncbi:MAG: hypothetical protein PHU46_17640 [Rhodocyclaceae bacterium]|nr:hypothetical protein [Rhodocyclaceae bacterium]